MGDGFAYILREGTGVWVDTARATSLSSNFGALSFFSSLYCVFVFAQHHPRRESVTQVLHAVVSLEDQRHGLLLAYGFLR